MIDKDPCNPERSRFVESLVEDLQDIEEYLKFGITRENVCVIATYIIHKFHAVKESDGLEAIEKILDYKFNERKYPKI
jgi:hypothetical protein